MLYSTFSVPTISYRGLVWVENGQNRWLPLLGKHAKWKTGICKADTGGDTNAYYQKRLREQLQTNQVSERQTMALTLRLVLRSNVYPLFNTILT